MVKNSQRFSFSPYRTLNQSLKRKSVWLRGALAGLVILAVFAALIGNMRFFVDRTAVINADTTALQVEFDERTYWLIEEGMTLCQPNPDLRSAHLNEDPICDQFLQDGTYRRLAIDAGDMLEIRLESDKDLIVRFIPCVKERTSKCPETEAQENEIWPRNAPGGFVVISKEALNAAGLLSLSGHISIGSRSGSTGGPDFLLGGSYEIREQNWLTRAFGRRSTILDGGALIPGASVKIISDKEPSRTSNGHFFASILDDRAILRVIALSGGHRGAIRMDVAGVEPFTIDPDWIDSVIANPVFLALAFLLGLLLNALQLASSLFKPPRDKR